MKSVMSRRIVHALGFVVILFAVWAIFEPKAVADWENGNLWVCCEDEYQCSNAKVCRSVGGGWENCYSSMVGVCEGPYADSYCYTDGEGVHTLGVGPKWCQPE